MATFSDLPDDLAEEEILSRVPITSLRSLRSTCKKFNDLSKNQIIAKALVEAEQQFLGFMVMDSKVCSLRFSLQGILHKDDEEGDLVDPPCIKQVSIIDHIKISDVFHCDGLLLCVPKNDEMSLLVWNPYLGQTRSIPSMNEYDRSEDTYALGYDNNNSNRNLKILRFVQDLTYCCGQRHEIYDFKSGSWKILDLTLDLDIWSHQPCAVSLKGNAYFFVQEMLVEDGEEAEDTTEVYNFLLCFDFTREFFGPRLPLPSNSIAKENVFLSCVREEKLAVLCQRTSKMMEIWITTKTEPNKLLWSKFLNVDITPLNGFEVGSFFIDEEKKVAVVLNCYQAAYVIGEDGYFKSVNIRETPNPGKPEKFGYSLPLACSSYVPSLVQLQINRPRKRTIHCKKCAEAGHNSRTCRKRARQASGSRASRIKASQSRPTQLEEWRRQSALFFLPS